MNTRKIVVLFLILGVTTCLCKIKNSSNQLTATNKYDSVIKQIYIDSNGQMDPFYLMTKQKAAQLKIDSLELGFDSLQIRIWTGHSLAWEKHLLVLKNKKEWSAELFTMTFDYKDSDNPYKIIRSSRKNVSPRSGWDDFINEIVNLNILTLPGMAAIEGYGSGLDGESCEIEIATSSKYRFYSYADPVYYAKKYQQADKMKQILELIEDEFNFERS